MAKKKPVPPRVRNMGVKPRPSPEFVGPMPAEPARRARGPGGRLRQGIANQHSDPIGPSPAPAASPASAAKKRSGLSKLKLLGLSALGAGGAGIFANRLLSNYRENLVRQAIIDLEGKEVDRRVSEARIAGQEESYRAAIDSNLSRLARYAPDLYASVAAGRKLPQGGVVIGGAPRQDLLNELGRAMADGRFSR